MLDPQMEQAMNATIREVKYLPNINVDGDECEPLILIDKHAGKIRVIINQSKLFRVLHEKNIIQQGLDILLVDTIKDHLKNMAEREESHEKSMKDYGGKDDASKVRESGEPGGNAPFSRRSGTKTDSDKSE